MNTEQALHILGVSPDADQTEIKKTYRKLMHRVHPDAVAFEKKAYAYTAQEINEAYEVLSGSRQFAGGVRQKPEEGRKKPAENRADKKDGRQTQRWKAPENQKAFMKRPIFHFVEDADGTVIGTIEIAQGKYLWQPEEEFRLFLKSIFVCSEMLLAQIDEERGRMSDAVRKADVQPELAYHLAQQFIDADAVLQQLFTPLETKGDPTYYIPAMLELSEGEARVRAGMLLYPVGIRRHRLYLCTRSGRQAGYLSFRDDRMYYIVIPLLEQKRAQIKVEVSEKQETIQQRKGRKYQNIDFWLRIPGKYCGTCLENSNLRIKSLLEQYADDK